MMVLCPKAGSLAFTSPGDEMSEVPSSQTVMGEQLVKGCYTVAWGRLRSNLQLYGYKAQNIPLYHRVPVFSYEMIFLELKLP